MSSQDHNWLDNPFRCMIMMIAMKQLLTRIAGACSFGVKISILFEKFTNRKTAALLCICIFQLNIETVTL